MTFGSSVTSAPRSTVPVEVDRGRVAHRHAVAHVRLVEPDAQAPLGGGQLGSVVDAVEPAVVLERRPRSRSGRPRARAGSRSVRYSSPVVADGVEGADPAPQPGAIEGVEPGVRLVAGELSSGVASRASTIRSTVPNSLRTTRPRLGRIRGEDAGQRDRRIIFAAGMDDRLEVCPGHERDVAGQDQDLGCIGGHHGKRRVDRVARATRFVLERERGPVGEDIDQRGDRG